VTIKTHKQNNAVVSRRLMVTVFLERFTTI